MMKKNNLILIPTNFEANFIIKKDKENFNTILSSGIGKKSIEAVKNEMNKGPYFNVILLGFAGCLNKNVKPNTAYLINKCVFKDEKLDLLVIDNISLEKKSILTVKKPIHSEERKKNLLHLADLVDMETYFLAKYCKENNLFFHSIRVALDDCTNDLIKIFKGQAEVPKHIKEAGIILNSIYENLFIIY